MLLKLLENLFNVIYIVGYNEFFLGKQKRDLPDKSRDGEDLKKVKESDIWALCQTKFFQMV